MNWLIPAISLISNFLGGDEDTPAPPSTPTPDQMMTTFQKVLQQPLIDYGVDRIVRNKNNADNAYDTSLLKLNIDPALAGIYNSLKNETAGNSEFYKKMGAAADAFRSPELNKNFLTFDKDSFYEAQMNPMRREADLIKKQNREEEFDLGLGNSTITGNRNETVDRNLADRSLDASSRAVQLYYDAGLKAQQLGNEATAKETEMKNEANKNYINTNFLTKNALNTDQDRLMGVADKMQQTDMYNKNTDYNEFIRKQNQLENDMKNVIALFTGQSPIQVANMQNAQQSAMAQYQANIASRQNQNNLWGSTLGLIGNALTNNNNNQNSDSGNWLTKLFGF